MAVYACVGVPFWSYLHIVSLTFFKASICHAPDEDQQQVVKL